PLRLQQSHSSLISYTFLLSSSLDFSFSTSSSLFFFFNDTATTEIYTLSLHDALPISITRAPAASRIASTRGGSPTDSTSDSCRRDRKSTRLNSSHLVISYAVFCLKKKKKQQNGYFNNTTTTCSPDHTLIRSYSPESLA